MPVPLLITLTLNAVGALTHHTGVHRYQYLNGTIVADIKNACKMNASFRPAFSVLIK